MKNGIGKIETTAKSHVNSREDLAIAYTPGVAEPCKVIAKDPDAAYKYTMKANTIAVVSDGSAVLGLGNIGAKAAMPVMEGKAVLFKEFGGVNAVPICLDTQDTEEIIKTVVNIAPAFGGINLEDISAPRCFEIESRLKELLDIPVFHDDQHGTAIVVLAGIINALKVTGKKKENCKIVVNGAGSAGVAITKLLLTYGFPKITMCDINGIISSASPNLNWMQKKMTEVTNLENKTGSLTDAMRGADIFVGVSAPGIVTKEMVASMNSDAILFAMANPVPEIMPDLAKEAGARVVGTGRSDFPNQVNNVVAFPGIFKGALEGRATQITEEMKEKGIIEIHEENVSVLKKDVQITDLIVNKKDIARLKEELVLPANKANIYQILWTQVDMENLQAKIGEHMIEIQGAMHIFVLYLGEDAQMPVQYARWEIPVDTQLECYECMPGMIGRIGMTLGGQQLEIRPDEDGEERIISLDVTIDCDIKIYEDHKISYIDDGYSMEETLIPEYHMFDFETLVGKNQAVMKADKRFRLEQESGKLLQVLSVKGSATVDDVEMTAQGLSVEGVWMADVLYLSTEDMTPVMSSSYMEPFTFFVETKNLTGNEDYQLDVRVDQMTAIPTEGEEIEIRASVLFDFIVFSQSQTADYDGYEARTDRL